ncbi:MAG TPA: hypothetical protein G4O18_06405 [Dehalococcoidia bacterium]|nr:hypothetical protein [Dehalococcoidia bacterium]
MTTRIMLSSLLLLALLLAGCSIMETNYIPTVDLGDAGEYWNIGWQGQSTGLYHTLRTFINDYSRNHDYVFGESDCNDMVVEIWDNLNNQGILSLIVVGNLEMSRESFEECNHAWLMVYNAEGAAVALDPSCGGVYCWEDARKHPYLEQYWEGIVYKNPTDLWNDFQERW